MTFSKALYNAVKTASGLTISYGNAFNINTPYYVMLTVSETGQATTMCNTQADAGELRVQFSYSGATGPGGAEDALETLRNFVIAIIGKIIYSGNTFEIWENITGGIRPLGGPSMNTWDAIFEATFKWQKL